MGTGIAKRIYLVILCIGLSLAIAGGVMLTVREIERSGGTPQSHVKIDVQRLPDRTSTNTRSGVPADE